MESNLGRLQVELYKEIKRNGGGRSLRAALSRFAEMARLIRPLKCRPYIVNLLPCLQRIAQRTEESVQETLGKWSFVIWIMDVIFLFSCKFLVAFIKFDSKVGSRARDPLTINQPLRSPVSVLSYFPLHRRGDHKNIPVIGRLHQRSWD